jgi:hypothetical protein
MKQFVKVSRQEIVDAYQWTPASDTAEDAVALESEPDPQKPGGVLQFGTIQTKAGQKRVSSGDYILVLPRDEKGMPDYDVVSEHEFQVGFAPVEAPPATKDPKPTK